jgi:hypothetical protein
LTRKRRLLTSEQKKKERKKYILDRGVEADDEIEEEEN